MQTGGRSHEQRRLLTPNKKRKDGIPFLLKGVRVRGLVALPARLRPPPPVTVTDNFCDGRRGDTPFGRMRVRVVCSDQQVPMKNMISCMRTPCVARGPSQACQRARRASAQSHTRHAKPEAIGSWGRGWRTSYPNGRTPESQPLRKGHADHAPPSGETTGFRDAFWFFSAVQSSPKPRPLVPLWHAPEISVT